MNSVGDPIGEAGGEGRGLAPPETNVGEEIDPCDEEEVEENGGLIPSKLCADILGALCVLRNLPQHAPAPVTSSNRSSSSVVK